MNRTFKATIGILVFLLLGGCAHTSRTASFPANMYHKILVLLNIDNQASEDGELAVGVCLLDPAANIPHQSSPAAIDPAKAPVVQITEATHDFGVISGDGDLAHRFKIRNVGNDMLKIKNVSPG